jgi:hypothetical protein
MLDRLADPARTISSVVAATAHTALAAALREQRIDLDDIEPPTGTRTLDGSVVDDAVVLDVPWLAAAVDPGTLVTLLPSDFGLASLLADLLDIPTASEEFGAQLTEQGRASTWESEPGALRSALIQGRPSPTGPIRVHRELTVTLTRGDISRETRVPYWHDGNGLLHVDDRFDVLPE